MTGQEILQWLRRRPFQPFRVSMDNGEVFDVRHPEFALIAETGALYIFKPAASEPAQVAGLPIACEFRNISTVEPLPMQTV